MKITSITIRNKTNKEKYMIFQGSGEFKDFMHESREAAAKEWGCHFDNTELECYIDRNYPTFGPIMFVLGVVMSILVVAFGIV